MGNLEEEIKLLIKENYGGVPKFADKIDVPPTTIYNALDRGMDNTRTETTNKIYRELNIDWNDMSNSDFRFLKLKREEKDGYVDWPVYGRIAAGEPIEMQAVDDSFPIPYRLTKTYPHSGLLRVDGDSYNKHILRGMFALINFDDREPNEHDPFAVCVNGHSATIKSVKKLENGFMLIPKSYDPTFVPTIYDYNDNTTEIITIIGKVVWATMPFDYL